MIVVSSGNSKRILINFINNYRQFRFFFIDFVLLYKGTSVPHAAYKDLIDLYRLRLTEFGQLNQLVSSIYINKNNHQCLHSEWTPNQETEET